MGGSGDWVLEMCGWHCYRKSYLLAIKNRKSKLLRELFSKKHYFLATLILTCLVLKPNQEEACNPTVSDLFVIRREGTPEEAWIPLRKVGESIFCKV